MDTSMSYMSLPENMFFLNQRGDMLRYLPQILNGTLWFNHIKLGRYTDGKFVPKEYEVKELYFFYHYDYSFSLNGFGPLKCVYYRKLTINNVEQIFPGKYPQQSDVTVGLHRYTQMTNPPMADCALECNLMKLYAVFMLSLYTLNDIILLPGADGINTVYRELVHLYVLKLDQDIQNPATEPTEDHLSRMLLSSNYTCLDRFIDKYTNPIYELLFKYAPAVLPHLPHRTYTKLTKRRLLRIPNPNPNRLKLIKLLKQYNRLDLLHLPTPLRQCNV